MSRALYTAVSGLKSHQTKMDVIGNNIANVSTYGFKTGRASFRDVFYQNLGSGGGSNATFGGVGGLNPYQIGYGTQVASIDTNHAKTGFANTGHSNDCYINGEGLFIVGTLNSEDGEELDEFTGEAIGNLYYTRVGMFDFDSAGFLVDSTGQLVFGVPVGGLGDESANREGLVAIRYDASEDGDNAGEGRLPIRNISIGTDGMITCIGNDGIRYGLAADGSGELLPLEGEDRVEKEECLAIAMANFDNPSGLEMVGNSYYQPTGNTGEVNYYQAGTNNMGTIKTGGLEMSGTDISQEFADMIMTQRGFQANSRIVSVVDSMLEEVVNLKR